MSFIDTYPITSSPKLKGVVSYVRAQKYDPTKTTALRNAFARDMRKRFDALQREINSLIVDQDAFGLRVPESPETSLQVSKLTLHQPRKGVFAFPTSKEKVSGFMEWLQTRIDTGILEVHRMEQIGSSIDDAWTNMYVSDSYKRGVQRARHEMGRAGMKVPGMSETGGINAAMSNPFHMDRVGVLASRVYEDLKGITNQMATQVNRVLSQGMIDGDGPRDIAMKLNQVISGGGDTLAIRDSIGRFVPAERRAETLARTEVIRAHHQGMIQEYKNWAIEGVVVQAEWITTDDDRVCEQCRQMTIGSDGQPRIYSLDEIQTLIPLHPNCRCIALPVAADKAKDKAESFEGAIGKITR